MSAPIWDRLPPKPLTAREWAAALPETLPNDRMGVFASLPDTSGENYTVGDYLDSGSVSEAMIAGRRFHYLVLDDSDGTLLVDGDPVDETDPEYELVTERWRREARSESDVSEMSVPEAVKDLNADEDAGFHTDGTVDLIAEYDGDTRRFLVDGDDYEILPEDDARDLRERLAEQANEAAVGEEWAVGGDYTDSRGDDPEGSSGENPDVDPDRPLNTGHGAVKRTGKFVGVAPDEFETAGDLPALASFGTEYPTDPRNGMVAYDHGEGRVVEHNGMTGEWSEVSEAVFAESEARESDENLLNETAENLSNGETPHETVEATIGDVSLGEGVDVPGVGKATVVDTNPVVVDNGKDTFEVVPPAGQAAGVGENPEAVVEDYTLRQNSSLVGPGESGVHADVTVRLAVEPNEVTLTDHPRVEVNGPEANETIRALGETEPRVLDSVVAFDGPLDAVGEALAANFETVNCGPGTTGSDDPIAEAVREARESGRAEAVHELAQLTDENTRSVAVAEQAAPQFTPVAEQVEAATPDPAAFESETYDVGTGDAIDALAEKIRRESGS